MVERRASPAGSRGRRPGRRYAAASPRRGTRRKGAVGAHRPSFTLRLCANPWYTIALTHVAAGERPFRFHSTRRQARPCTEHSHPGVLALAPASAAAPHPVPLAHQRNRIELVAWSPLTMRQMMRHLARHRRRTTPLDAGRPRPRQLSSSPSALPRGITNAARTGAGDRRLRPLHRSPDHLIEQQVVHRVLLRRSRSPSDRFAPHASALFVSFRSTWPRRARRASGPASAGNAFAIGRAAASNWLIGFRPRINSIVRSMLLVEYIVEST